MNGCVQRFRFSRCVVWDKSFRFRHFAFMFPAFVIFFLLSFLPSLSVPTADGCLGSHHLFYCHCWIEEKGLPKVESGVLDKVLVLVSSFSRPSRHLQQQQRRLRRVDCQKKSVNPHRERKTLEFPSLDHNLSPPLPSPSVGKDDQTHRPHPAPLQLRREQSCAVRRTMCESSPHLLSSPVSSLLQLL